mgnify:CR=1 FL=1
MLFRSEDRIRKIDSVSKAFIYAVSSASTTGANKSIENATQYLSKLKSYNLKSPIMTGFNIKTNQDVRFAWNHSNGAIIGSAFINAISQKGELTTNINNFINSLKS